MRIIAVSLVALALSGCATAYWEQPGAGLPALASEAEGCYQAAVAAESPAALAVATGRPPLLPRTEPPPRLWTLAPRQAALERFDAQLRYERCMLALGWRPTRPGAPAR